MTASPLPRPVAAGTLGRRLTSTLAVLAALLGAALLPGPGGPRARAETRPGWLTSRPRLPAGAASPLAVGDEVRTGARQRRRALLPDGSVVYVNENSTVQFTGERRLRLAGGEIFVEAAPGKDAPLLVRTPKGEVSGQAAKFAVRAAAAGAGVVVARGQVSVSGLDRPVRAGQQVPPGADRPAPGPRVSEVLDWTRDLMIAAESPLVPGSPYAGGALVVVDPDGQEAKLLLRKYHVDVHVEDGFARTTIDQTYFNHEPARLEGTFYFPLPADASLSRLAMYVDGNLMEGGMAERDYARTVYESIVYRQKDPALLEWVDGTTFKMRVFPLEPRQEKRLVLSYTQRLPSLYGRTGYRFPAGHSLARVSDWSFHARVKNGADLAWASPSHALRAARDGADLVLDAAEKDIKADRDVVLALGGADEAQETVRFSSAESDGAKYLMLRCRPDLPTRAERQRRDWVFLFESSGDRDPLPARTQIDIVQGLLAQAEPDDTFVVLAAGTRVQSCFPEARPATPDNIAEAVAFLEGRHLIGALDLGQALAEAGRFLRAGKEPYLVHVGSGIAAMGERRDDVLAKSLPDNARYVGVGVGRRWARGFMKTAAEHSGGYFTQINPDEPISWRAFDLAATLNTPRLLDARVTDPAGHVAFLTDTSMVAQGEELCAVARLGPDAKGLPERVTVTGTVDGRPFERTVPVRDVATGADYLPRTWARLEIDRLLAENPVKNKEQIIGLSKAMYVMTPFTSLLVLENEDMYEQYKVDRGRKDHWAPYPLPAKIPIMSEGDTGKAAKPSAQQVLQTVLVRQPPRFLRWPGESTDEGRAFVFTSRLPTLGGVIDRGSSRLDKQPHAVDTTAARILDPSMRRALTDALSALDDREKTSSVAQPPYGGFPMVRAAIPDVPRPATVLDLDPSLIPAPPAPRRINDADKVQAAERMVDKYLRTPTGGGTPDIQEQIAELSDLKEARTLVSEMMKTLGTSPDRDGDGMLDNNDRGESLIYSRPNYSGNDRLFFDLLSYAPGLNTTWADVRAVLEAEAAPGLHAAAGSIDPGARQLIERARAVGWQALTLPPREGGKDGTELTIRFDGTGRYAYERALPVGLRERVVCDGKTLLHLYPDLGVGARRAVSRFHRAEFSAAVPWAVPAAEDLARGADVALIGERAVEITPHAARPKEPRPGFVGPIKPPDHVRLRLVFDADGRLAERVLVEMPADRVISRELCSAEGVVRVLNADSKEVSVRKGVLRRAEAPDLAPDVKNLVVLPLPFRSPDYLRKTLKTESRSLENLRFEEALALLAAYVGAGDGNNAQEIFRRSFHDRNQRQIGFYVLLAAVGQNLDAEHVDVLAEHLDEPLAQYLALHTSPVLRRHASQWAVGTSQWRDGFLQRLAVSHALYQRWEKEHPGRDEAQRRAERDRAFDYVRRNAGTVFGWALLCRMQDRAGDDRDFHLALAEAWPLFQDVPGLGYAARYERARSLWHGGRQAEARRRFKELYEQTLARDALPPIDGDFRAALLGDAKEADEWSGLLRDTATRLVQQKHRPAVLALARQCWEQNDPSLANHLLGVALEGLPKDEEGEALRLAGLEFLWQTGQFARADDLLQTLLADERLAGHASLWRLASRLAERREMPDRRLACLERALEVEYQNLPDVINLEELRRDYGTLLDQYQRLAEAMLTLKAAAPPEFVAKVVRAADRWRALDPDGEKACQSAGRILQTLGERDMVWDYLTTPIALRPNESGPWANLAQELSRKGDLELADRAFAAAFEAEPTNAQLLWDRAQNLRQAGKRVEARKLFRRLADGTWQPRFAWLQTQARAYVDEP